VLHELIADPAQRHRLGTSAGLWVRAERTWDKIADRVDAVYRQLIEQRKKLVESNTAMR